jgi:hypothetical protein
VEKAQRLLSYNPKTPYSQGVVKFVEWLTAKGN